MEFAEPGMVFWGSFKARSRNGFLLNYGLSSKNS